MPIAASHSLPNKKDRKPKPSKASKGMAVKYTEYEEVEEVIDKLYCDICNGVSKSDCMKKLMLGVYGKEMKKRNATEYYKAAMNRLAVNADIEAQELRNLLYSRYETILEECINKGDMFNAKGVLDSMAKIFLGVDNKPQTAIQINGSNDGKVTVNFGFDDGNKL